MSWSAQFPVREIIGHNRTMRKRYFPIGNFRVVRPWIAYIFTDREISVCLASKLTPFTPNLARFLQLRQFMAQFARRMPERRHRLFFAENDGINLRKNCAESFGATYRLARARNSVFMDSLFVPIEF